MEGIEIDLINLLAAFVSLTLGASAIFQKVSKKRDLSRYLRFFVAVLLLLAASIAGRLSGQLHHAETLKLDAFGIFLIVSLAFGMCAAVAISVIEDTGRMKSWGEIPVIGVATIATLVFSLFHVGVYNRTLYLEDTPMFYFGTGFGSLFLTFGVFIAIVIFSLLLSLGEGNDK